MPVVADPRKGAGAGVERSPSRQAPGLMHRLDWRGGPSAQLFSLIGWDLFEPCCH